MFDSLRRAEAARKKKSTTGSEAKEARTTKAPREIVTHPAERLEGIPDDFVRELGILRNSVEAAMGKMKKKTILFAGSAPAEGTTTLVSSFAELLSVQSNEKTLLVELNARRPSLKWKYGLSSENGVTHFFSGKRPFEAIIQRTPKGAFDIAHVGEQDPVKIQLHLELMFPKLIEEARMRYDTLLIDAPPVIGSPETPPLTSFVDGTVLVVRAGKTKREIIQRSLDVISQFEGRVLGIVLNRKKYYIPDFIYRRI
jgi:Mrp family chromosome partitioning ATPase